METFDNLWQYCTSNNRACPMPMKWSELFSKLKNTKQKPSGGWEPGLPLILAVWYEDSPFSKQRRFKEHIEWAKNQDQLEEIGNYLRSLNENEWFHFGEE